MLGLLSDPFCKNNLEDKCGCFAGICGITSILYVCNLIVYSQEAREGAYCLLPTSTISLHISDMT